MVTGMSDSFNPVDFNRLRFPAELKFEYIRVYQRTDFGSVGCDPAGTSWTDDSTLYSV